MIDLNEIKTEEKNLDDLPANCLFLYENCICMTDASEHDPNKFTNRGFKTLMYVDFENKRLNFEKESDIFYNGGSENKIRDLKQKILPNNTHIKMIRHLEIRLFPIIDKQTNEKKYLIDTKNQIMFEACNFFCTLNDKKNFNYFFVDLKIKNGFHKLDYGVNKDNSSGDLDNYFSNFLINKRNTCSFLTFLNAKEFVGFMDERANQIKEKTKSMPNFEAYVIELLLNIDTIKYLLSMSAYYEILKILRSISNLSETIVLEKCVFNSYCFQFPNYIKKKMKNLRVLKEFENANLSKKELLFLEQRWYNHYENEDIKKFLNNFSVFTTDCEVLKNKVKSLSETVFKKLVFSTERFDLSSQIVRFITRNICKSEHNFKKLMQAIRSANLGIHKSNYDHEPYENILMTSSQIDQVHHLFKILTDHILAIINWLECDKS